MRKTFLTEAQLEAKAVEILVESEIVPAALVAVELGIVPAGLVGFGIVEVAAELGVAPIEPRIVTAALIELGIVAAVLAEFGIELEIPMEVSVVRLGKIWDIPSHSVSGLVSVWLEKAKSHTS